MRRKRCSLETFLCNRCVFDLPLTINSRCHAEKILFLLSITLLFTTTLFAQFEGEIKIEVQELTEGSVESTNFSLTTTKDRIFIQADEPVDVMSGMHTDAILIRNDLQDFVFRTKPDEALKVSKDDLDGLVQLIKRFQGQQNQTEKEKFDWEHRVEETGDRMTILGYNTEEMRLKGDDPNQYVSIWLTDEIKVHWGLLLDFWYESGEDFADSDIPIELVMNRNSFPLHIEVVDYGETVYTASATEINTDSFDRSVVELSDSVRLIGFSDMMMNMLRNRR